MQFTGSQHLRVGFLGAGNLATAIIRGLIEKKTLQANHIFASNRSAGKLVKLSQDFGINNCANNEELVEKSTVVILAVKPQDMIAAIEPIAQIFSDKQLVISLAAGVTVRTLEKYLPHCRLVRAIPNTPTFIGKGITGFFQQNNDDGASTIVEDLFSSLGIVQEVDDEDLLDSLTIACSSGTGFVFELMMIWQEWLVEHGFDETQARRLTVETFLGASMLANNNQIDIEELQNKVTSKRGVTAAGLQSMREYEVDRVLRIAFEKAALRAKEMAKEFT